MEHILSYSQRMVSSPGFLASKTKCCFVALAGRRGAWLLGPEVLRDCQPRTAVLLPDLSCQECVCQGNRNLSIK